MIHLQVHQDVQNVEMVILIPDKLVMMAISTVEMDVVLTVLSKPDGNVQQLSHQSVL